MEKHHKALAGKRAAPTHHMVILHASLLAICASNVPIGRGPQSDGIQTESWEMKAIMKAECFRPP